MVEVKLRDNRSMAQRIQDRLRPSCTDYGKFAPLMSDATVTTNPTRTVTGIRYSSSQDKHGADATGLDIFGKPRRGV
jgi:hypothetical protein